MSNEMNERSKWKILPTNKVVTAVITKEEADLIKTAVVAAGFDEDNIMIHHGEAGKQYIDSDGSEHGFFAQMMRTYQRLAGPEKKMLDMAESTLNAGGYLIGIQTDGSDEQQAAIYAAVGPLTTSHVFFCTKFTIIQLQNQARKRTSDST